MSKKARYARAYQAAVLWLEAEPALEIRSALKEAASREGIPYGDKMEDFVAYAEARMGLIATEMTPLFEQAADRDAWIEANAAYFTAIRGRGRTRTRSEFPAKDEALRYAARLGDGRTLIYAIAPDGASAHIGNH